jgi:hypothetical protein
MRASALLDSTAARQQLLQAGVPHGGRQALQQLLQPQRCLRTQRLQGGVRHDTRQQRHARMQAWEQVSQRCLLLLLLLRSCTAAAVLQLLGVRCSQLQHSQGLKDGEHVAVRGLHNCAAPRAG